MFVISREFGVFNMDNLSVIHPPLNKECDYVIASDAGHGHRVTRGLDNYQKIIEAINNRDAIVEVD